MKKELYKIVFIVFLLIGLSRAYSQKKDKLPFFRIGLTDSSYFDKAQLKKNRSVIFIYFLPDCDHCKNFTKRLTYNMKYFRNKQIVMITNSPLNQVRQFEREFRLKTYPNIILGTEGLTFTFQRQFKIERFPFVAAYNNRGHLIKTFGDNGDSNELIKKIRRLYMETK